MKQDTQQNPIVDSVQKSTMEERVCMLRNEGRTYSDIAGLEGISASKARYLFEAAARRAGRKPSWTDGLSDRLANSLRWLGFKDREEVARALASGHLNRLARFERGLRGHAIEELALWLNEAGGTDAATGNAERTVQLQSIGHRRCPGYAAHKDSAK
ncbi:MAG: hypothetical protein ABWY05_12410 [Noviherbaspirillum sp.]